MEIVDLVRQTFPDFEFVRIRCIRKMEILEVEGRGITIICQFVYVKDLIITMEFTNVWNVKVVFDGGQMELGEFFVSPLKIDSNSTEGFHVWDELTGLEWKCGNIRLLNINGGGIVP